MRRWAAALALGGIAALLWLERRRPLRQPVEPGAARVARNAAIGLLTAATVNAIERPIVTRLARETQRNRTGLVYCLPLSNAARTALAIALMDYTLYWWHVLLHRLPWLWRLHRAHHIDRDLDTSTALRFHFTEFLASIPWRCAQVLLIGVSPRALALWQRLTFVEILFHHSNVRLREDWERALSEFLVTPRLHGLHHSIDRDERDSNFSSGLALWDRLHGTARVPMRDDVTIGLPGFERPDEVTLTQTLALPFRDEHESEEKR